MQPYHQPEEYQPANRLRRKAYLLGRRNLSRSGKFTPNSFLLGTEAQSAIAKLSRTPTIRVAEDRTYIVQGFVVYGPVAKPHRRRKRPLPSQGWHLHQHSPRRYDRKTTHKREAGGSTRIITPSQYGGAQMRLCVITSSTLGNHAVIVEYTVTTVGSTSASDDKKSLEHPLSKLTTPTDNAS